MNRGSHASTDETQHPFIAQPRPWAIAILLLFIGMIVSLIALDKRAPGWCMDMVLLLRKSPYVPAVHDLGRGVAALWCLLLLGWAVGRPRLLVTGLLAMALSGATVSALKFAIPKIRPERHIEAPPVPPVEEDKYEFRSFPSGDTASVFALAFLVAMHLRGNWRFLPFLVAAAVGALRVASVHHWPSDVFAGAIVGILCGAAALYAAGRIPPRAPPLKALSRRTLFWLLLAIPLTDICIAIISGGEGKMVQFLRAFGAFTVPVILYYKGETWFAWIRNRFPKFVDPNDTQSVRMDAACLVLIGLCALAVIPSLSWTTLYDRDEGYYAEVSREMIERNDYFVPHIAGEPWLEKPPLTFWMMAGCMKILGKTTVAARLPSALCGLIAIWLTYLLGKRVVSPLSGLLAAVVLATTFIFTFTMRMALLDTPLACCVLLSMLGFWKFLHGRRWIGFTLFYLGCGLGFLAKGPLGVALPVISLFGFVLLTRRWRLVWQIMPIRGAVVCLAVIAVWLLPAALQTGGWYLHELIWVRTIQPVFSPLQGHGGGNFGQYLALVPAYIPVLFIGFGVWCVFLVASIRRTVGEGLRNTRPAFLIGWAAGQLLAFSLVSTKLLHYVIPLMPALAIMIGSELERRMAQPVDQRDTIGRWAARILTGGGILMAILTIAAPIALGFKIQVLWFIPAAVVAGLGGWKTTSAWRGGNYEKGIVVAVISVLLFMTLFTNVAMASLEYAKGPIHIAERMEGAYAKVAIQRYRQMSLLYYLDQTATKIDRRDIKKWLASDPNAVVILYRRYLERARERGDLKKSDYSLMWEKDVWVPTEGDWDTVVIIRRAPDNTGGS